MELRLLIFVKFFRLRVLQLSDPLLKSGLVRIGIRTPFSYKIVYRSWFIHITESSTNYQIPIWGFG